MVDTPSSRDGDEAASPTLKPCSTPFLLEQLRRNEPDKLGNKVEDICWVGADYAIYRSERGVYVHFSNCRDVEKQQRIRFTEICPELCELRYLTAQMRPRSKFRLSKRPHDHQDDLFEHNMAQALMLVMEDKTEDGRKIAEKALAMAVRRVTNDNTIRYVRVALLAGIASLGVGVAALAGTRLSDVPAMTPYIVAGMAGATGAVLSIATRLQAFELRPCDESSMNKLMAAMRVGLGIIAAIALFLMATTVLSEMVQKILPKVNGKIPWETPALLGFLAGFAERLIPNLLRRTGDTLEADAGTPVQAVRRDEERAQRDSDERTNRRPSRPHVLVSSSAS
jgi:hypothetical protein